MSEDGNRLHARRPAVYLDQWVWIRLAQAQLGRPNRAFHADVLAAVRDASADGVAFPLSSTHYWETLRIRDPRQRRELVEVMAPISAMRTLRSSGDLLRHQFLTALHESVGRPTFRPGMPEVLGLGAQWAFRGVPAHLRLVDAAGAVVPGVDRAWLRHLNQHAEAALLAGPSDEEIPSLKELGYVEPREIDERPGNRLAWEKLLVGKLLDRNPARSELRVWLLARELTHEYLDLLNALLAEYRLTFDDITKSLESGAARSNAVDFVERVPTLRIAAEMKLELFRDRNRSWTRNMLSDIDALSIAIPYCRVVVADRDAAAILRRARVDTRHGTTVLSDLKVLPGLLEELRVESRALGGDPTGWDEVGPGQGFHLDRPARLRGGEAPPGCSVRMTDPDGTPTAR